ncbi:MAG: PQQ-binding-like beta-propeller repeat protein [Isosphaeraceae bacterium]
MGLEQLIFIGLNGYVAALHRETGELVWKGEKRHSGYVTLLLDGDRLIVSTNGYIDCLSPFTGKLLWHNPMKGFGMGAPTALVSVRGQGSPEMVTLAAAEAAAAAAAQGGGAATYGG